MCQADRAIHLARLNVLQKKVHDNSISGYTSCEIHDLFHRLADQGEEISVYRISTPGASDLPAQRIDIIIRLQKLKTFFLNDK